MPTPPHTEQPTTRTKAHQERIGSAVSLNIKAATALRDIESLFIAALCVLRMQEEYFDTSEDDKRQALETLMEYGRGAVSDATEGHEGVWHMTSGYIFGKQPEDPEAETEQPDQTA